LENVLLIDKKFLIHKLRQKLTKISSLGLFLRYQLFDVIYGFKNFSSIRKTFSKKLETL
jgi:hypothetical protein